MQNSNLIEAQAHASLEREVKEFQRYILIHHSAARSNMGRIHGVGRPVDNKFAIWGKIRTLKKIEHDRLSGVYSTGILMFEFAFPLKTLVPQIGDYIEAHGVVNRQPRQRFLIKEIFPDSSISIGKCIIAPIGQITPTEGS